MPPNQAHYKIKSTGLAIAISLDVMYYYGSPLCLDYSQVKEVLLARAGNSGNFIWFSQNRFREFQSQKFFETIRPSFKYLNALYVALSMIAQLLFKHL